MKKIYLLITVLVLIGVGILTWFNFGKKGAEPATGVMCTMDAKQCPDGSFVGRTGPKCEFTPCPEVTQAPKSTTGDIVLGIGQSGKVGDLTITVNSFVSESRCPSTAECIWAGEFKANVTFVFPLKSETRNVSSLDAPYSFEGYRITISRVTPYPASTKITEKEYRITFHVEPEVKKETIVPGTI